MNLRKLVILTIISIVGSAMAWGKPGDKELNRPYADHRAWHLGFSVGLHTQDLSFTHNGFMTDDGQTWYAEQASFTPGFCVNGLIDFRLNDYFNVRFAPGLYFGDRPVTMIDTSNPDTPKEKQSLKSTYVVLPIDLKFSGARLWNVKPYVTAGVMPAFDVAKKRRDPIQLTSSDFYLTVGFGLDTYLPYFKFIPEIKFCFGLKDVIRHDRPDLEDDASMQKYTQSITKATSRMVVLTFYFE